MHWQKHFMWTECHLLSLLLEELTFIEVHSFLRKPPSISFRYVLSRWLPAFVL